MNRNNDHKIPSTVLDEHGFAWDVINALGQGVTIVGADDRFEYVNPAFAKMVGRVPQELIGLHTSHVVHPNDHDQITQANEQRLVGESSDYEVRLVRPDGTGVDVHITSVPRQMKGQAVGAFTIITDMTEGKRAKRELEDSQHQLMQMIALAMDAIVIIDDAQQIVLFNKAAEEMFGYTAAEVIGQPQEILLPERVRVIHQQHVQKFGQTNITSRYLGHLGILSALHANGQEFPIEVSISRVGEDKQKLYMAIVRDMTEKIQTEEALRQSEIRYRALIEEMPGMLCRFQEGGILEFVNEAYVRTFGQTQEELIGRSFLPFIPKAYQAEVLSNLNSLSPESPVVSHEHPVFTADGEIRWYQWTNRLLSNIPGQPATYQAFGLDITVRKQAEQALLLSEERYRSTLDNMMEGCQIIGFDWRYHYVNDAVAAQGRATKEALLGYTMMEVYPGIEQTDLFVTLTRCMNERVAAHIENEFVFPDGSKGWFELSIQPVSEGLFILSYDITERKLSEEALKWQAILLESISDVIITTDLEFHIQSWNNAAEELYGWSAEEVMGKQMSEVVPTHYPFSNSEKTIAQLFAEGVWHGEVTQIRKDGRELYVSSSVTLIYDEQGQPISILGVNRDITKRKRAEQAFRQSEEKLRLFIEHAPASLAMFDQEMRYLAHSRRWLADYGLADKNLVGRSHYEIFPEITLRWKAIHRRALAGEVIRTDEDQFMRLNEQVQWLRWEIRPWYTVEGDVGGIVIFTEDITERKRSEQARRQSETQLQNIIETVPDGVVFLDTSGRVILTNPVADQYLNSMLNGQKNKPITQLGNRPLAELLEAPEPGLWHEIVFHDRIFEAKGQAIENNPADTGWVLILRDVTQERDITQRVQQQERLAAVGQLAAGIAHDFNNIMAVIMLYAQLLSRTNQLPSRSQQKLATIEKQAQRATDLIQQILDFSRQSVLERHPVDLLPFLKELVKLLKRTLPETIQIEFNYGREDYIVEADPSRIQQVVMNLAVNARDAMLDGGKLRIKLALVETKRVKTFLLQDMPAGQWIEIQIEDNGHGISANALNHIFEPFFTTKEVGKGTGLG
ncbi:MAG: PAS domain S-box protein, partial [Anaerolineales bacterium]|nr:PAS domain S-box protein [Anaerolineales bacterium]